MKDLILKFKNWIIKKLGGYTEQYSIVKQEYNIKPIPIEFEHSFDQEDFYNINIDQDYLIKEFTSKALNEFCKFILDNNLIKIQYYDDIRTLKRIYKARVVLTDTNVNTEVIKYEI